MRKKLAAFSLALANILFFSFCLCFTFSEKSPDYDIKMEAVAKSRTAQQIIGSRIIGEEYTPITTTLGAFDAKVLSTSPDFAAVAVDMLFNANVHASDVVAVNMSSSFPALNIAVIAAIDTVGAKPIIVSSVGSSMWGANRPEYTWADMENSLVTSGIWKWKSSATGIGGGQDMGSGLTEEGNQMIRQAIERSGVPLLESRNLEDAINQRLDIYRKNNDGDLPKVLINIGGSHVIFGKSGHDFSLRQGLNKGFYPLLAGNDGLAAKFINAKIPVIHFININRLATQYDIRSANEIGKSKVFKSVTMPIYIRIAIICWLLGISFLLVRGSRKAWW